MTDHGKLPSQTKTTSVADFLAQAEQLPTHSKASTQGRLLFAIDATASRQPTWDMACQLQGQMFLETAALGKLAVQLCYYHGYRAFHTSPWLTNTQALLAEMQKVQCLGGQTQIGRVLNHGLALTQQGELNAIVFVGDCLEEPVDTLAELAGQLKLKSVPLFIFQEGHDAHASQGFAHLAKLSDGAHCQFDQNSASQLQALLTAVAVYAVGGFTALAKLRTKHPEAIALLERQLR
ncbi:VWA domain-containing protein [Zooshikella harenae]|uniref:VWA domain-containing protein n=1 Tax=Zooshikella harenae TaxID=2827238 RepID=A0ABS5ZGN6_9GAMM|nr:VWA domain-containing protein [Zooshikella harenae]MBU2713226.1 VWA domain-containing protein [Zooshikella harenae]